MNDELIDEVMGLCGCCRATAEIIVNTVSASNHESVKEAVKNIYIEDNYSDHIQHGFSMGRNESIRAIEHVFNPPQESK